MNVRMLLGVVLSAVAIVSAADSPTFSVTAHIIASGTSVHLSSSCFGLDTTIAEPVAGYSSGGSYGLGTGFSYVAPVITDTIFSNGFEDCSQ